jgi:hypothetical protein
VKLYTLSFIVTNRKQILYNRERKMESSAHVSSELGCLENRAMFSTSIPVSAGLDKKTVP